MLSHCLPALLIAVASLASAPTAASYAIRYHGSATLDFRASNGRPHPGAMNGTFDYRAIFYYDARGEQRAASLIVADVMRAHYRICPDPEGFHCPPLSFTATSIGSATGTTPEDYISIGVYSPGQFGSIPLFGQATRRYDLVPGDTGSGYLAWALYDNSTGYAYNWGTATVDRLVVGVPEPSSWLMIVIGFGIIGAVLRRRVVASVRVCPVPTPL